MRRRLTAVLAGTVLLASCASPTPSPTPAGSSTSSPSLSVPSTAPSADPSIPEAEGTWFRLDDMSAPRWSFTALELVDGRVFVVDQEACNGMSDLGGPPRPPGPTDLLDPATGRWTPASALNATRSGFVAVRLRDGRVLVTGGDTGWHRSYSSTKLFDAETGRWTATGLLNTARMDPVGALLADGRVLVAGGTYSEGYSDEEDFYSGRVAEVRSLTSAEIYDPATGRWSLTGSLHDPGSAGTAYALPDGRVLVVGIAQTGEPYPAEVYDPRSGTWTSAGSLVYLPGSAFAVLADGALLVIGGTDDDRVVATVRRFDPGTGTSVEVAPLPAPRTGAIAVRLADGRVLVAGGTVQVRDRDMRAPATSTALVYGPVLDVWTEASPMPFASEPGQGLLLRDGSALVIGGTVPGDPSVTDGCPSRAPIAWVARFVPAVTP